MKTQHTPAIAYAEMREALKWIATAPLGKITYQEFISQAQRISKAVLDRESTLLGAPARMDDHTSLLAQREELKSALKHLTGFAEMLMEELNDSTDADDKHRRASLVSRHVCRNETFRHVGSFIEQARQSLAKTEDAR